MCDCTTRERADLLDDGVPILWYRLRIPSCSSAFVVGTDASSEGVLADTQFAGVDAA